MRTRILRSGGMAVLMGGALLAAMGVSAAEFRWEEKSPSSLKLWEGERPVFTYNHGVIRHADAPADRARSSYIHPLYGLDGEVLTDDFPADHWHHRGLFWAWPHVEVEGKAMDLWMLKGIRHEFSRWLERRATAEGAVLELENVWRTEERSVMTERVRVEVPPAGAEGRILDLTFTWTPVDRPVRLVGAEGKSYGGLTLRYAPGTNTVITTPLGSGPEDLYMKPLPWADLTRDWTASGRRSGVAILIPTDHPDYPPTWLTRHYGVLCLGWPGVEGRTFLPGEPVRLRYRLWIHRGGTTVEALTGQHREMVTGDR